MDFLLWVARSLHLFSVVVWLGGLMYQAVVTLPVARAEQNELDKYTLHILRRFIPFVWMCVWTILITGICLMLFNPRFILFEYHDRWSIVLGLKQLMFFLLVFFSFGYARMFARLEESISSSTGNQVQADTSVYYQRLLQFGKINVGLGIAGVLITAAMN